MVVQDKAYTQHFVLTVFVKRVDETACIHTKYADRMAKCLTYNVCTQSSASVLTARAACEATFCHSDYYLGVSQEVLA